MAGFQPGNDLAKLAHRHGPQRELRKRQNLLALQLREDPRMVHLLEVLWSHAFGHDPATGNTVDDRGQRDAIRIILDRAYGTPQQNIHIEETIRAAHVLLNQTPDAPAMTLEQVQARKAILEAHLAPMLGSKSDDER